MPRTYLTAKYQNKMSTLFPAQCTIKLRHTPRANAILIKLGPLTTWDSEQWWLTYWVFAVPDTVPKYFKWIYFLEAML